MPEENSNSNEIDSAILELKDFRDNVFRGYPNPVAFPDPGLGLDLESRAGNEKREVKHITQTVTLHVAHFQASQRIKAVYLVDAYLAMHERGNPWGIYMASRSILELAAFLNEVIDRLKSAASKSATDWRGSGREFCKIIMRARYGTSDPRLAAALVNIGKESREVFSVTNCIKNLSAKDGNEWIKGFYDTLCDYVHHNLSSGAAAVAGGYSSKEIKSGLARFCSVDNKKLTALVYHYPIPHEAALEAARKTAADVLKLVQMAVELLNFIPSQAPQVLKHFQNPHHPHTAY